jgi:RNA polymerase primary sigma factor
MTNSYYCALKQCVPLSVIEEDALIQRLKTRPTAQDRTLLITSNLRFVVTIARRYRQGGVPLEDLINEGNIGLIEAVRRFDPDRGTRFITYAVWWIRKSILAAIANQSLIRIPAYQQRKIKNLQEREKSLAWLSAGGSRTKDLDDRLADASEALEDLLQSTPRDFPLLDTYAAQYAAESDRSVDDFLADESAISPERQMMEDEDESIVAEALRGLKPLELKIIRGRFGMEGDAPKRLWELAEEVGLSRERVRQIEKGAKTRIRRSIRRRKAEKTL